MMREYEGEWPIKFAPNQTLPAGYMVEFWDCDEHYHWVAPDRSKGGYPETYSEATCCRFSARRGAWAHFNAQSKEG